MIENNTIFIQLGYNYLGYNYLEPTLVFTEISPESVMADTCRGVIVGLAPPPDTLHRGTRVHLYKGTKIKKKSIHVGHDYILHAGD